MKKLRKIVSAFLVVAMFASLSIGLSVTGFATGESITAEVQGTYMKSAAEQDITIRISISGLSTPYCVFGFDSGTTVPEGFTIKSFSTSNVSQPITAGDYNTANGKLSYFSSDMEDTIPGDTYYDVVITAPENAVGQYEIVFNDVVIANAYGTNKLVTVASVTATLTISEPVAAGYTVALSTSANSVETGGSVDVYLDVTNSESSVTAFNAMDLTLTYDSTKFTFDSTNSTLNGFSVDTTTAGTLVIRGYGSNVGIAANHEFVLKFTAGDTAASDLAFALTSAKVAQATQANQDISVAAITGSPVAVSITEPAVTKYTVTFVGGADTTGTAPTQEDTAADDTFALPANPFTKTGYTFIGWNDGTTTYQAGDTYTMPAANVTFTAQWKLNDPVVTPETSTAYLNGYTLIKATITDANGKVPTYDGQPMYQITNVSGQSAYDEDAYYYIVKTADYEAGKVGYGTGDVKTITKDGDANQTNVKDINDAQFVYNLYNTDMITVSYTPTVAQLLASDVNGDGSINVQDCQKVVELLP